MFSPGGLMLMDGQSENGADLENTTGSLAKGAEGPTLPPWVKLLGTVEAYARISEDPETKTSTIRIYGPIGRTWGGRGVTPTMIAELLDKAEGERVLVRINSPGGIAFDGMAIYNILKQDGRVDTQVDGVAASAAGLIFMAGKERLVPKSGANLMIHLAETGLFAWGNSKEINAQVAKRINALNAIDAEQRSILAAKTGSKDEDISKLLEAQTWYSPSAAVAAKLATGYVKDKEKAAGKGKGKDDKKMDQPSADFSELMKAWGYPPIESPEASDTTEAQPIVQHGGAEDEETREQAEVGHMLASAMLDAYRRDILEE